ncbi:MAG: acyl-ACP--UDP-N-acetylglucosamine O-acyltransferase [Kangiellaceae bacterium]|nr:acyl-ACP--UDP-N-acetylglucosamine O-acyltransferase [Kangiellaceae bacterium]
MIHSSAVIHPAAKIANNVQIGPFSVIEENVEIGEGTVIGPHVVINGHTSIGKNNRFYQFSSIGEVNQDQKYKGEPTKTIIGDNNVIRECCTIHRGTIQDRQLTSIGNDNLLMAYTHIAHDCQIGNHVIIANSTNIGGHVRIDDWAILGGFSGVHQFCRIGAHSFLGIRAQVTQDILPFVLFADGAPRSINVEGIRRRGYSSEEINLLKKAYRLIFRQGLKIQEAIQAVIALDGNCAPLKLISDFMADSARGIAR